MTDLKTTMKCTATSIVNQLTIIVRKSHNILSNNLGQSYNMTYNNLSTNLKPMTHL